ncbi:MAG: hypothetical protein RMK92_10890, partial [Armatimonadota bacterium]|nr:hypothetical protein [Armatimonadota bacterium]
MATERESAVGGCTMLRIPEVIQKKRDGGELSQQELEALVLGGLRGEVPDYQVAAWLMAVYFR